MLQSAASCYIELIVKESDNNVKLIVLDRLIALKDNPSHEKVLRVSSTLDNKQSFFSLSPSNKTRENAHARDWRREDYEKSLMRLANLL